MVSYAPLSERIIKTSASSSVSNSWPLCSDFGPCRPVQYKDWSHVSMKAAMQAVLDDGMSIRRASKVYSVPKSTLGDRISGRVLPGRTSGPALYLSREEEEELVAFLCRAAQIGHGHTRQEVIAIVECVLASRGVVKHVTSGWWAAFIARNPMLVLRTPATLSTARAGASDRSKVDIYFDELESTLDDNKLIDKPCQIFNMDETGMPLDPKPLNIVTWKDHKKTLSGFQWIKVIGHCCRLRKCGRPVPAPHGHLGPQDTSSGVGRGGSTRNCMAYLRKDGWTRSFLTCGFPNTFSFMHLLSVHLYSDWTDIPLIITLPQSNLQLKKK